MLKMSKKENRTMLKGLACMLFALILMPNSMAVWLNVNHSFIVFLSVFFWLLGGAMLGRLTGERDNIGELIPFGRLKPGIYTLENAYFRKGGNMPFILYVSNKDGENKFVGWLPDDLPAKLFDGGIIDFEIEHVPDEVLPAHNIIK